MPQPRLSLSPDKKMLAGHHRSHQVSLDLNSNIQNGFEGHYTSLKLPNIQKTNEKVHLPSIYSPQNMNPNQSMFSDENPGHVHQ